MAYVKPEDVDSPRQFWRLIAILDEGAENTTAIALGRWNGPNGWEVVLAIRWNGIDDGKIDKPNGNPQSRGLPTWFILPKKLNEAVLRSGVLSQDKVTQARGFIPETKI